MKKRRNNKELGRLRAQIEILKTRLGSGEAPTETGSKGAIITVPTIDPRPRKSFEDGWSKQEITLTIKKDLSKTLFLTVLSLLFIFSLKWVALPNQEFIIQKISSLYQFVSSQVSSLR